MRSSHRGRSGDTAHDSPREGDGRRAVVEAGMESVGGGIATPALSWGWDPEVAELMGEGGPAKKVVQY